MKYRLLGNSGLRVSEAALGTMTFGEEWGWGSVKDEARKVYDAFREAGGEFHRHRQPGALSGTSKSTRRGEPNRSRIPLSLLCQKACPRECVRRHARPDHGLTAC
jgi:hypothetical protein